MWWWKGGGWAGAGSCAGALAVDRLPRCARAGTATTADAAIPDAPLMSSRRPHCRSMASSLAGLVQPVLDLVDAGEGAGFVLVAAGRAADRDAADRVLPDLDRHAALAGGELGIELRGIECARRGDPFG